MYVCMLRIGHTCIGNGQRVIIVHACAYGIHIFSLPPLSFSLSLSLCCFQLKNKNNQNRTIPGAIKRRKYKNEMDSNHVVLYFFCSLFLYIFFLCSQFISSIAVSFPGTQSFSYGTVCGMDLLVHARVSVRMWVCSCVCICYSVETGSISSSQSSTLQQYYVFTYRYIIHEYFIDKYNIVESFLLLIFFSSSVSLICAISCCCFVQYREYIYLYI